jgi:membrane fusion protein, multidrug efflux system
MNRPLLPLSFVVVAASAALSFSCGTPHGEARPESAPPLSVAIETTASAASASGLEATGTIEAARRASPGTILAGRVTTILKREGERVRRGEALARVESGDVAARVAQAEAAVVGAQAAETNARLMRDRLERLVAKQAASPKSLEDAVAGYDAARANLRAAEEGVRAARVMLGYGEVRAPFDGVIERRFAEEGDTASPGMPMFIVVDTARMKLEAALPESLARGLTPGSPVAVIVDGTDGASRDATLAEILPAADPATRTVTARVLLDNADGALRPGMFARVRFPGDGPPIVFIPESAIVRRGPLTGVFIVDDDVARLRWITVGASLNGRVEAASGLAAGERIVTAPTAELADGRRVEIPR